VLSLGEVRMVDYSYYEELEEEAFNDKVKPKKKPKKQRKTWKENSDVQKRKFDYRKKDKKNSFNNPNRA
tara:strand:+ start:428 stop:634 length:207 start_codon:yes stop_codon:yes gene_type:complete